MSIIIVHLTFKQNTIYHERQPWSFAATTVVGYSKYEKGSIRECM